jgi:hypothetical protein
MRRLEARRWARWTGLAGVTVTATTREDGDAGAAVGGAPPVVASCPLGPISARAIPATPTDAATATKVLIRRIRSGIFAAAPDAARAPHPGRPDR